MNQTRYAVPRILAAGLLTLAACAPPADAPAPAEVLRVQIVGTNDFHGRLLPQSDDDGRELGGSATMAAHFDSARVRFDGPTVLIDAGDVMQGTATSNLTWGRAAIDVYNAKGYDAVALGNHEFDWGLDTLRARISESDFPWLGANVYATGTGEQPEWARPWVMVEQTGVRVGVIGIALATTPDVVMAGRTDGLGFGDEAEAIDRSAREAWRAGAHFVVVSAHEGATCEFAGEAPEEPSRGCDGRIMEVAEAVTEPVDLIVAGHTHLRNHTEAGGIPIMQAERYTLAYSITELERRDGQTGVTRRTIEKPWADAVDPDTALLRIVAEGQEDVRPLTERIVVEFAAPMSNRDRAPEENALGNLIADAQRAQTGAHVGLVNNGSLRRGMPAGPISYGELFELQPFQNELVAITLAGAELRGALEHALTDDGRPAAHISGMTVRYDPDGPPGSRVHEVTLEDGRVLEDGDEVTLGTTEFLATGGDGFAMFVRAEHARTGLVDVDALASHLESLPQPVEPPVVGRWETAP